MSIKDKLVKGAIWNSISQFGSQAINFIVTIILARLLTPTDFGLLGQVAVIVGLLSYFSDFGILVTLIQRKDLTETDYNSAFYGMFFISLILYALVFAFAPYVALYYKNQALTSIVRILFLQFFITQFCFINEVLEIKNLNYKNIVNADLVSLVISGCSGIIMAYKGFGVWSLVYQSLIKFFFRTLIIFITTNWRPKLLFSIRHFLILFRSGLHFLYRNVIKYFSENVDFFLIGKIAGSTVLGLYTIAFNMSSYPFTKVQQIFGQMVLPAFNLFNDDIGKVKKSYLKISQFGAVFLAPVLIVIFFGVYQIVDLLLGYRWIGVVPIVKILVIYLVFSSVSFADESILISLNKIKTINIFKSIVSFFLLVIGYFAVLHYGVKGMATTFTILSIMYTLITKTFLLTVINIKWYDYIISLLEPITLLILFSVSLFVYSEFLFGKSFSSLFFLLGEGVIYITILSSYLFKKGFFDFDNRRINIDAI